MTDSHTMIPMGAGEPETFRGRIYGVAEDPGAEAKRRAFVAELAGPGVIDCPAIDPWVCALQDRGWLPDRPELEPNPDGPGKLGRWRLTDKGRAEWAALRGDLARSFPGLRPAGTKDGYVIMRPVGEMPDVPSGTIPDAPATMER